MMTVHWIHMEEEKVAVRQPKVVAAWLCRLLLLTFDRAATDGDGREEKIVNSWQPAEWFTKRQAQRPA